MLLLKYVLVEPFPLHDSAMKGHLEVAKVLVEPFPLHDSAIKGHLEVAKVLVESTTLQCYEGSS